MRGNLNKKQQKRLQLVESIDLKLKQCEYFACK